MKRILNDRKLYFLIFLLIGAGCSDNTADLPPVEGMDCVVQVGYTRATEGDGGYTGYLIPAGPPELLFWHTGNAVDINQSAVRLYGRYIIPGLETTPYPVVDPGFDYPNDGSRITVAGYAPLVLRFNENDASLTVPDDDIASPGQTPNTNYLPGRVDILTSNTLTGSQYFNFTGTMDFGHAQSRIIFKAISSKIMNQFVNNVRVRVPYNGQLVQKLEWRNGAYQAVPFPGNYNTGAGEATPENHYRGYYYFGQFSRDDLNGAMLSPATQEPPGSVEVEQYRDIGVVYATPGLSGLQFTVSANIGDPGYWQQIQDNPIGLHKHFTLHIPFVDSEGRGITLRAGDSYTLSLVFRDDGLGVNAMFPQWESGGNIIIPIPITVE